MRVFLTQILDTHTFVCYYKSMDQMTIFLISSSFILWIAYFGLNNSVSHRAEKQELSILDLVCLFMTKSPRIQR